jgi:hypothetical protein
MLREKKRRRGTPMSRRRKIPLEIWERKIRMTDKKRGRLLRRREGSRM